MAKKQLLRNPIWNNYGVDFISGINNETYKYYIDFASKFGIEYVILDEGRVVNNQADLFQVVPEIDLQELIEYAKAKNVGIVLWAGHFAMNRDIEKVCKHYAEMGVKGFKVDFTQGAMKNANKDNFRAIYSEPMSQGSRCRLLAE